MTESVKTAGYTCDSFPPLFMCMLFNLVYFFHDSLFQMQKIMYVYICIHFINKDTKSDDVVTAQQIIKWFCCQTLQIISLSVFQLCQLWVQIPMFNLTFELEKEVDSLSSLLKCDMGKSNSDSSCNDKYECSTCRKDNTGILSTVACGTATSEHSQPLLVSEGALVSPAHRVFRVHTKWYWNAFYQQSVQKKLSTLFS